MGIVCSSCLFLPRFGLVMVAVYFFPSFWASGGLLGFVIVGFLAIVGLVVNLM